MEATYMSLDRGMDKEDVIHVFDGILLSHKKGNNAICSNMDELETVILSEVREEEIPHDIPYMQNLKRNDTNELMYKTETDSQT